MGDYIDVLLLKDGTSVKGIILEQLLGKSVTIQTQEGDLLTYQISNIEKVSKELDMSSKRVRTKLWMNDFKAFKKGYSFELETLLGEKGAGFRIYNGYKFSRFANLSLGVGFEIQSITYQQVAKPMLTLNLALSGDVLNKRLTPYYQVELGYGYVLERMDIEVVNDYGSSVLDGSFSFDGLETLNYGGPMGALVLGAKLKINKGFIKLGFDYRLTSNFYDATPIFVDEDGKMTVINSSYKGFSLFSGAGLRFGIGF